MKLRNRFVSNSSTSSFIISIKNIPSNKHAVIKTLYDIVELNNLMSMYQGEGEPMIIKELEGGNLYFHGNNGKIYNLIHIVNDFFNIETKECDDI